MEREEARNALSIVVKITKKRIDLMNEVKAHGGNKYQQLEARLLNEETGKLMEDPVIYAIRTLENRKDVVDFYRGYFNHVNNNLEKYKLKSKKDVKQYVINDISSTLALHFYDKKTHEFWNLPTWVI